MAVVVKQSGNAHSKYYERREGVCRDVLSREPHNDGLRRDFNGTVTEP